MTGKRSNQQSQQSKSSRRSILRVSGVTLASITGVGIASTGSALADDGVDTDFNPDDRDEVVGFFKDIYDLSEEEQNEYAKDLSKEQKEAICDVYMNADLEITTYSEPVGLQPTDSYTTATETTEATGKVAGQKVYTHKQILTWEYSGTDYKDPSQELEYSLPGPFATFKEKTEDDIDENASSFIATLSAEYAADVAGFERGGEATIVTEGKDTGEHEVLEKDAPTS